MKERLFLYRVNIDRAGISVNKRIIFALNVFSDPAVTSFAVSDFALVRAEFTADKVVAERRKIRRQFSPNIPFFQIPDSGDGRGRGDHIRQ
jgi:hypothetical protein